MGAAYTCEADEQALGIPCRKFKAHFSYPDIQAELDVTYHWSSEDKVFDNCLPISITFAVLAF
jgi:hypothetical protein